MRRSLLLLLPALVAWAPGAASQPADPTRGEVPLPARAGWEGALLYDAGETGIWWVGALKFFPRYGALEVLGLDDRGRATLLIGYSGRWFPVQTVDDGRWLGTAAHLDLDPKLPGPELYVGGERGRLYQVYARPAGGVETRVVADVPGEELHTLVGGELDPRRPGPVLLLFCRSGLVLALREGALTTVARLPGRVRDAVVLPGTDGPELVAVSRAGRVHGLALRGGKLRERTLLRAPVGFARLAVRPGDPRVLYVGRDDGLLVRLEATAPGRFRAEPVYAGPLGLRGVAAGRFAADPEEETVAVFGYSRKVQLLRRRPGEPWRVETIFVDRGKGHWLAAAELDGRNGTRELLCSGYGGRIVLLRRPPGYGLPGVATEAREPRRGKALVVVVAGGPVRRETLSPYRYGGGFLTKTLALETLVTRDREGRLVPALAERWEILEGGRVYRFRLRAEARFHDGTPVTARAVVLSFRRWVGLPEHAWLPAAAHIEGVRALDRGTVEIILDRPMALLPDLCAVNPTSVLAPASFDEEGNFSGPVGTGPLRLVDLAEGGRRLRYRAGRREVVLLRRRDPVAALRHGEADLLVESWIRPLAVDRLAALGRDPRFVVEEGPGSVVVYLTFRPGTPRPVRRTAARAVDRRALVAALGGGAEPAKAWAAPGISWWPAPPPVPPPAAPPPPTPLRLLVADRPWDRRVAAILAAQLRGAGLGVQVRPARGEALRRALREGRYDLRLERTWGLPYDPYLTLVATFLPPPHPTAASHRLGAADREVAALVGELTRTPTWKARLPLYRRLQTRLTEEAWVVPLCVPRRHLVRRRELPAVAPGPDPYHLDLRPLLSR